MLGLSSWAFLLHQRHGCFISFFYHKDVENFIEMKNGLLRFVACMLVPVLLGSDVSLANGIVEIVHGGRPSFSHGFASKTGCFLDQAINPQDAAARFIPGGPGASARTIRAEGDCARRAWPPMRRRTIVVGGSVAAAIAALFSPGRAVAQEIKPIPQLLRIPLEPNRASPQFDAFRKALKLGTFTPGDLQNLREENMAASIFDHNPDVVAKLFNVWEAWYRLKAASSHDTVISLGEDANREPTLGGGPGLSSDYKELYVFPGLSQSNPTSTIRKAFSIKEFFLQIFHIRKLSDILGLYRPVLQLLSGATKISKAEVEKTHQAILQAEFQLHMAYMDYVQTAHDKTVEAQALYWKILKAESAMDALAFQRNYEETGLDAYEVMVRRMGAGKSDIADHREAAGAAQNKWDGKDRERQEAQAELLGLFGIEKDVVAALDLATLHLPRPPIHSDDNAVLEALNPSDRPRMVQSISQFENALRDALSHTLPSESSVQKAQNRLANQTDSYPDRPLDQMLVNRYDNTQKLLATPQGQFPNLLGDNIDGIWSAWMPGEKDSDRLEPPGLEASIEGTAITLANTLQPVEAIPLAIPLKASLLQWHKLYLQAAIEILKTNEHSQYEYGIRFHLNLLFPGLAILPHFNARIVEDAASTEALIEALESLLAQIDLQVGVPEDPSHPDRPAWDGTLLNGAASQLKKAGAAEVGAKKQVRDSLRLFPVRAAEFLRQAQHTDEVSSTFLEKLKALRELRLTVHQEMLDCAAAKSAKEIYSVEFQNKILNLADASMSKAVERYQAVRPPTTNHPP